MQSHVYKQIELTGSSPTRIEDAVRTAIARASKTMRNIHWFQVVETRGHVEATGGALAGDDQGRLHAREHLSNARSKRRFGTPCCTAGRSTRRRAPERRPLRHVAPRMLRTTSHGSVWDAEPMSLQLRRFRRHA